MRTFEVLTAIDEETVGWGRVLGLLLDHAAVITIEGVLGAGKTQLVKGIASGLGIDNEISSPTYTICVPYSGRMRMLHVDAYRLKYEREVHDLGLDEAVNEGAVVIVEWPDGIEHCLPPADLKIRIAILDQTRRRICFSGESEQGVKWADALQNAGKI